MINWIIALLAILIFFISKYKRRNNKQKSFSLWYWLCHNWEESVTSTLATVVLLLIFLSPDAQFNLNPFIERVPFVSALPVKMVVSAAIGLGNTALLYAMFRNKKKK